MFACSARGRLANRRSASFSSSCLCGSVALWLICGSFAPCSPIPLCPPPSQGRGETVADEEVVGPAAENGADARRHNRHPPPAVAGAKHVPAPACNRREQPRTEVPRGIDRIAGVEAKRRADQ